MDDKQNQSSPATLRQASLLEKPKDSMAIEHEHDDLNNSQNLDTSHETKKCEVLDWLTSFGQQSYHRTFIHDGYDNLLVCAYLDDDDLDVLGITLGGVRKTFLIQSQLLRNKLPKDQQVAFDPRIHQLRSPHTSGNYTTASTMLSVNNNTVNNSSLVSPQKPIAIKNSDFWIRARGRAQPYDCELPKKSEGPNFRILLIRHGESLANVDMSLYKSVSDHAIPLSDKGKEQAREAGDEVKKYFNQLFGTDHPPEGFHCRMWTSPYKRARQTAQHIKEAAGHWVTDVRENIMLTEQQFGLFEGTDWASGELDKKYPQEIAFYRKASSQQGRFWAKVPLGESRYDVCIRTYQSFGSFHRDAAQHNITNLIIVSHGITLRAFLMMWLHLTPEWFEVEPNPKNCSVRLMENGMDKGYIWQGPEKPRQDLLLSEENKEVTV